MKKIAFLFSGQGSQYPQMGKELYDNFSVCKDIYTEASECFGFDVAKASFESTKEELSNTSLAQPAIFTLSIAAVAIASQSLPIPVGVAGHSLGEYAALTYCGVMDKQTGFKVIKERAKVMQEIAEKSGGAMFAIMNVADVEIEKICLEQVDFVVPVNYNCTGQTVIAGEESAAVNAAASFEQIGAKVVRLSVNAAFHCKLMEGAAVAFYDKIKDFSFGELNLPFYSNVTGGLLETIENPPEYFKKHIVSPVRFTEQTLKMQQDGIDTFIEFGPSKVLSGLVRRTFREANVFNIENIKTLEKTIEAINTK